MKPAAHSPKVHTDSRVRPLLVRTAVKAGVTTLVDGDDGRDNSFGAIGRPRATL